MKAFVFLLSLLSTTTTAFASNCETTLLQKLNNDSNIRVVNQLDTYNCGKNACAVTFEHDASPYPNPAVLAFLDTQNGVEVHWVPVANRVGHENIKRNVVSYVELTQVGDHSLVIDASIETPRDRLFWPRHKVYFQETLNCVKK